MLKPKVEPQKQLREWQRRLRRECLNVDRQIRGYLSVLYLSYYSNMVAEFICLYFLFLIVDCYYFRLDIEREEKNVQKAVKEAAKRNDMSSAKVHPPSFPSLLFSY